MKPVCISHGEDADGLICAAYLRHLMDVSVSLVTYDDIKDALKKIRSPVEEIYVCDLNFREELYEELQRIKTPALVSLAVKIGRTRLIDNVVVG